MFREDESKYIGLSKIQELIKRPSLEATFNFAESRFDNQLSEFAVPWKLKKHAQKESICLAYKLI